MGGNTFGKIFRITTFGESHGQGIGVVIDGCPSCIPLSEQDFIRDMMRRRPGGGGAASTRKETDQVTLVSGVFEGMTTGTPIAVFIKNRDVDSRPYEKLRKCFRPGHADFTYYKKYGHVDFRGGGRASARETAARVAAGVVAGKILAPLGLKVQGYTIELGGIRAEERELDQCDESPFCCPDPRASQKMTEAASEAKKQGDSIGGIVEIRVIGCPAGMGEPVFDKLEADLAKAVLSVGAVKGFEIGAGFGAARLKGSENNDPLTPQGFASNHAGGTLGGVSNGEDIVIRAAVKPIPSIAIAQDTINHEGHAEKIQISGRHDAAAIPRIIPVLEAMIKVVLADHYLRYMTARGSMPGGVDA